MTVPETLEQYPLFDVAVLRHGFTPYMRDYELQVETDWTDGAAGRYQYLFTHCVAADYETRVPDHVWPESWDDAFTDYERYMQAGKLSGFVWGVNWAMAYPGWEYQADSPRAKSWSEQLGHHMHEVSLETNAYLLRLVFHEVRVRKINDDTDLIRRVLIPIGK